MLHVKGSLMWLSVNVSLYTESFTTICHFLRKWTEMIKTQQGTNLCSPSLQMNTHDPSAAKNEL